MVKILWINRKVLTINGGRNRQMFFPKKNCNPLFTLKLNPCIVWAEYVPLFCKRMRLVCSSGLLLELFDDIVIIFFLWCITELVSNIDRCSTVAVYWGRKTVKKWVINREVINENHGNIDEPGKKNDGNKLTSRNKKQSAAHVPSFISFPSSAKQQGEMTSSGASGLRNANDDGWFYVFPFAIERYHFIFSLSTFSDIGRVLNRSRQSRISPVKHKFIFDKTCDQAYLSLSCFTAPSWSITDSPPLNFHRSLLV